MINVYNITTKKFKEIGLEDYLRQIIDEEWLTNEMDKLDKVHIPYLGLFNISRIAKGMGFMEDCIEEEINVKYSVLEAEICDNGGTFFEDDIISFTKESLLEFMKEKNISYE